MNIDPILERLDKIVALLEYQTFGPAGAQQCLHVNTKDIGVMGDTPGTKLKCKDCGTVLGRK